MTHTDEQIAQAAVRFEQLAAAFEDDLSDVEDLSDLRAIAICADEIAVGQTRLRHAVESARAQGRSWNRIAIALGVSRQAARQRFGKTENMSRR